MPVTEKFPVPMHSYLASVLHHWGSESASMAALELDLSTLGLADRVAVKAINDTALEVKIGRDQTTNKESLPLFFFANLADVGLGVSQVLPILVALQSADDRHLVLIEQPELHLHPKGIHKLAELIVNAVQRGVRVVLETHSELLLLGIQTQIAGGRLDADQASLNWFSLDEQGHTLIQKAEILQDGSFGDWPVDFLDVELLAQRQYLDAVSSCG